MYPRRAGLYLRISKDDGTTLAVERQEAECRRKAEAMGWAITETYVDQGKSASNRRIRRPSYDRMLADAQAGRLDGVIIWAHDRLTRQPDQLSDWLNLADQGFKLATVAGDLDLGSDTGRLAARIFVAMAEGEVRRKGARQASANRQRAERGLSINRTRPFGFERDGMTHQSVEAAMIRSAVADIVAGTRSLYSIRQLWNRQGVHTVYGKPWSSVSLKRVLSSWRIAGVLAYQEGTELYEAQWEPIVSREDLEAVRAIFAAPDRNLTTRDSKVRSLLSGLVSCGLCGRPVFANKQPRGFLSYGCSGAGNGCALSISRHKADDRVAWAVCELLADPGGRMLTTSTSDLRAKRADLAKINGETSLLVDMVERQEIDIASFRRLNSGSVEARKALEAEITRLIHTDAVAALVDGLRLSEGRFASNMNAAIEVNARTIRHRFDELALDQQRTVIRGLFPVIKLFRATSGGRQTSDAIARRLVVEHEFDTC